MCIVSNEHFCSTKHTKSSDNMLRSNVCKRVSGKHLNTFSNRVFQVDILFYIIVVAFPFSCFGRTIIIVRIVLCFVGRRNLFVCLDTKNKINKYKMKASSSSRKCISNEPLVFKFSLVDFVSLVLQEPLLFSLLLQECFDCRLETNNKSNFQNEYEIKSQFCFG